MKRIFLLTALSALSCAAIDFDTVFGDHMVLQQGREITLHGAAGKGGNVTLSFGEHKVPATIKGKTWYATLPAMTADAEGKDITVTQGKESATLSDVVVGEVWVASGQSNMLFRMNQTDTGKTAIAESANGNLRFFHSEPQVHTNNAVYGEKELNTLKEEKMYQGQWAVSAPETSPRMSAVGYYFGKELQQQLGVPVGIIHASLGGSEMMAWFPEKLLKKKYPECTTAKWLDSGYISEWVRGRASKNMGADKSAHHPYQPGFLFRTGIQPWVNFPVAGVIWYQGESDAEYQDMKQNSKLLHDLITSWRHEFKNDKLPFVQVQLPRINDKTPLRAYWPEFRLVQADAAQKMDGVECVTTIDLGSKNSDVHPNRKVEVGQRLALTAAAKVYGKDVVYTGPVITAVKPQGDSIAVTFDHAEGLKTTDGNAPVGFEVAGGNGKFSPATAEIKGNKVVLSSPEVKKPVSVRYGWATYIEPNLVNEANLPTVPYPMSLGGQKH